MLKCHKTGNELNNNLFKFLAPNYLLNFLIKFDCRTFNYPVHAILKLCHVHVYLTAIVKCDLFVYCVNIYVIIMSKQMVWCILTTSSGTYLVFDDGDIKQPHVEERTWARNRFHFDDVAKAMLTLFTVSTFEGWPG